MLLRAFRERLSFPCLGWGAFLLGVTAYTYMAGWFYAVILGAAVLAFNARRFRTRQERLALAGACTIWLLAASPALWMWFFDPHTILRTERISTFANGVSIDSLRVSPRTTPQFPVVVFGDHGRSANRYDVAVSQRLRRLLLVGRSACRARACIYPAVRARVGGARPGCGCGWQCIRSAAR